MKLLIVSAAYPPMKSGGADFVMQLADRMAKKGVEVKVLTGTNAPTDSSSYTVLPMIKQWSWLDLSACFQVLQDFQPDVVDIHFTGWIYNDHPMITLLPTLIKRIRPKTHVCTHLESFEGVRRELSTTLDVAIRFLLSQFVGREQINFEYGSLFRDSNSVIFLAQHAKRELCSRFAGLSDKCAVIPPPPIMPIVPPMTSEQAGAVRSRYGITDQEIVLSFFGYIYPGKGLETLISALDHLAKQQRDVTLLVVGGTPDQRILDLRCHRPNYLEELKSSAEALHISRRIRWIGYSDSQSELPSQLLRASHMCVLPFDDGVRLNNSSFSYAAMHGMPIITTATADTEDVFISGENTVLLAPGQALQLSQIIIDLFDNSALQERLARGALALAQSRFSWEQVLDQTVKLWH